MTTYFCDIEGNGLLEDITKIHCLSAKTLGGDIWTTTNDWEYQDLFCDGDTIIGHNFLGYDYPVLEKLGIIKDWTTTTVTLMDGTVKQVQLIDTLAMSREYWPDNPAGHGLEAWAKKLGTYKPHIEDWHNLPIEDYIERCEEDCLTTEAVFIYLCEKLGVEL